MIRVRALPRRFALPSLHLGWGGGRRQRRAALALPLPLLVAMAERGPGVFLAALAASGAAEAVFALMRGRPASWHGVPTAMAFAVMAPAGLPLWQAGVAVVFGMVLADPVFRRARVRVPQRGGGVAGVPGLLLSPSRPGGRRLLGRGGEPAGGGAAHGDRADLVARRRGGCGS